MHAEILPSRHLSDLRSVCYWTVLAGTHQLKRCSLLKPPQTFCFNMFINKNCLLCFRQEVGGSGARRSEAGADREEAGAAEGGVRDQPVVCWEAKQAHLF